MSEQNNNLWEPTLYSKRAKPQFEIATNMINTYQFKGNENILDIGSGPGNITALIAEKVPHGKVLGIDCSKEMVAFAKSAHYPVDNLSFEDISVTNISFEQKFDLITSFNTLHCVQEQELALTKICEHLSDNGHFLACIVHPAFIDDSIMLSLEATVLAPKWLHYFKNYIGPNILMAMRDATYEKLLVKTGFKVIFFNENCYNVPFSNKLEFANWFETWLPHRKMIPVERREEFFIHLVENYLKYTNQKESMSYGYVTWEFLAQASK